MEYTFFDQNEIYFLRLSVYLNDCENATLSYTQQEIQSYINFVDDFTHCFFDEFFCVHLAKYNSTRLNEDARNKSKYINYYLQNISIKNDGVHYAYNLIMQLFGLNSWARCEKYFNLIELKFKVKDSPMSSVTCLEDARVMFEELSTIFNRPDLEEEYDYKVCKYLYKLNARAVIDKLTRERLIITNNYYQTHCIPKLKFDYRKLNEDLTKFIRGGTIEIYRSIIEYHKLPENAQVLTMLSSSKADIVRFAKCFNISYNEISIIFGIQIKENNESRCIGNEKTREFVSVLKKHNSEFSLNYL